MFFRHFLFISLSSEVYIRLVDIQNNWLLLGSRMYMYMFWIATWHQMSFNFLICSLWWNKTLVSVHILPCLSQHSSTYPCYNNPTAQRTMWAGSRAYWLTSGLQKSSSHIWAVCQWIRLCLQRNEIHISHFAVANVNTNQKQMRLCERFTLGQGMDDFAGELAGNSLSSSGFFQYGNKLLKLNYEKKSSFMFFMLVLRKY